MKHPPWDTQQTKFSGKLDRQQASEEALAEPTVGK